MDKTIDILMATYNGEKYLKEQIDSILNQTYKNFRLIISDDCSKDATKNILKEYEKKDDRITVYIQEKNIGVTKNFEFLLNKVENEFYMLSDQDDVWFKDKVEKSLKKIEESKSDLVFTDLKVTDESLNVTSNSYWSLKGFKNKIKKHCNFDGLYLNNFVTGCTIISKKKFIPTIIPFKLNSKNVIHDYWIALVVSLKGKITYLNQPTMFYRQHLENEIGSKRVSDTIENFEDLRNMFIDVKIDHFKVFIENEKYFSNDIKMLNEKSYRYFKNLKEKKYINIANWNIFFKLYKYENFKYKMLNFLILNIPVIARVAFAIRKKINTRKVA